MKRRDIEEILRREAEEHQPPEVYDKVIKALPKEGAVGKDIRAEEGRRAGSSRAGKRIWKQVAVLCACLALCLAVTLPFALQETSAPGPGPVVDGGDPPGGSAVVLSSAEQVYAMGAVTTASLLSSEFSGGTAATAATALSVQKTVAGTMLRSVSVKSDLQVSFEAEQFHCYFLMLDGIFGDEVVTTSAVQNTDEAYAQYEIKLTVTGMDMNGAAVSHVMYYTETLVKEETEKGESEREYSLVGVMLFGGTEYALRGERTEESEKNEEENELKIRAYPDENDRRNYVQMEQETSSETGEKETEYVYTVVRDGEVAEEISVEFESETEHGKTQIEYELEFISGTREEVYRISHEDGGNGMKVSYQIGSERGEFHIEKRADGSYLYRFSDGTTEVF